MDRTLLILGCSQLKRPSQGLLPALDRYDGPVYRVIRSFLRKYQWPQHLSMAVLSAEHGLFGIMKGIENYDKAMDATTASTKAVQCTLVLKKWAAYHDAVCISLGKKYMPALKDGLEAIPLRQRTFGGYIGQKLHQIKAFLQDTSPTPRITAEVEGGTGKCYYFLPDWDDLIDPSFDFEADRFSGPTRAARKDKHCCVLLRPPASDGILVSLAQQTTKKGPLRRPSGTELGSLAPPPLRRHFGLSNDQFLFGDCGAFTYVNDQVPSISVESAVGLYETYGFDFGASVDHIPVKTLRRNGEWIDLSKTERQARVDLTRRYALHFLTVARERKARFQPVGTIQGLTPGQYARSVLEYYEFGYRHLAIGGLVPLQDSQIEEIVRAVIATADSLPCRPWIHLFGIFRPRLQSVFRELKIDSFDSASYFRKAWLRSSQNYLSANGQWYTAIRVPMTSDARFRKRLEAAGVDPTQLVQAEQEVLRLLCQYDRNAVGLAPVLDAVLSYDQYLPRSSETQSMRGQYRRTLLDRPWRNCKCTFCKQLGIHMLIFRGANRNRRRGAHNTLMLYGMVSSGAAS